MAQTKDNSRPATSAVAPSAELISRNRLLPFGWTLFTAVWLLFPIGFVVQVLRSDLSPLQLLAFLASMAAFVLVFLWLMLRYPFPDAGLARTGLRIRIGLLLTLVALALYVELVYGGGVPYRFMYVVVAAAVTLPALQAAWMVAAVTVAAGTVYAVQVGWGPFAASWADLVPFALIGVGMIAVSRLVVTVRELRAAREEIARLAVAEERLRFARDLHDLLGHSLSQITLKSELAGRLLPTAPETERAAKEIRDIEDVARKSLSEVREAVAGYRQPTLDGELEGAREMLEAAGISCRIENRVGALPNATDAVLGWAVREGVTNVIRHSRAKRCQIRVAREGEEIRAEVSDDGLGSESEHDGATGSGLAGLAERVAARGGDFKAGPLPEGGFRLRVSLPVGGSFAREDGRR
jgi:two-component system sensor histidine kinase DesK